MFRNRPLFALHDRRKAGPPDLEQRVRQPKMRKGKWAEFLLAVAIAACGRPALAQERGTLQQTGEASVPVAQREVVYDFVCWMESDGTIKFWSFRDEIRNREGEKRIGDAIIQYRPDYPQYRNILKLVGPLAPGQKKACLT